MSNLLLNCSICNKSNSVLINILETDTNQMKWSSKLALCVPSVNWSDDYCICPNCIGKLEIAYTFYHLCIKSYEMRKLQVVSSNTIKIEPIESKEYFDLLANSPDDGDNDNKINNSVNESNNCLDVVVQKDEASESEDEEFINVKIEQDSIDSDTEFSTSCPPLEDDAMEETTSSATLDGLPEKSRVKYENAYRRFMEYRQTENTHSFAENVLIAYFEDLSTKVKSSTLWSNYSMLRSTLVVKDNVDIAKYRKLRAFLKRMSHGYQAKKSKILSKEQVHQFIVEAPDETFLTTKVALIFGIAGACRRDELAHMNITDIDDLGSKLLITIPDNKTNRSRSFIVTKTYLQIYRKYTAFRPKDFSNSRFFYKFTNGKGWNQVVGIHQFGKMPQIIANYLKLPNAKDYTGHCFRRSSAKILIDSGADLSCLKSLKRLH